MYCTCVLCVLYVLYVMYVRMYCMYCVYCVSSHVIPPCRGVCCSEVIRCEDWTVVAIPNESFEHARFEQELSKYREVWKDNIRTYGRLYCPNYEVRTSLQCRVLIPCFLVYTIKIVMMSGHTPSSARPVQRATVHTVLSPIQCSLRENH